MSKSKKPVPPCSIGSFEESGKRGVCLCGGLYKFAGPAEEKNYFRWHCLKCSKDVVANGENGAVLMDSHTGSLVDFLSEQDRQYFEAHPDEEFYDRAAHPVDYPKEFHVPVGSNVYVRVFNIVPGLRLRIPWILVSGVPKDVVGIPTKAEDIYPQIREIREIMRVKNLNSFEMI